MRTLHWFFVLLLIITGCKKSGESSSALDDDTRAWWQTTTELSSDAMEGRDTGSPGYERAAALVAERFKAAGLEPYAPLPAYKAKMRSKLGKGMNSPLFQFLKSDKVKMG